MTTTIETNGSANEESLSANGSNREGSQDPTGLGLSGDALRHFEGIVANVFSMRSELLRWASGGDPRRDIADECGYPAPGAENSRLYQDLYDYEPIPNRIVRLWPDETWKVSPLVYEAEKADRVTEFEKAWDELGSSIQIEESWHREEEGSTVWSYLHRLDCLAGIGHWGCLLFGLDDGLDLSLPAYGIEEINSYPTDDPALRRINGDQDAKGKPIYRSRFPGLYELSVNQAKTRNRKLRYLRVFPESLAQIVRWESNWSSPRFGLPVTYLLSFNDPNSISPSASGSGLTVATREVHWTRVLHVAAQLESSESVGVPRMRPVLRRCLDLVKLYGGSAEMYYKGAFMGLSFETHPALGGKVQMNKADLRSMIENYQNGLQRYLALTGLSAKTLAPTVVDPTPQINTQIQSICIQLDVPQRIFMGSERGELASGQDAKAWDSRVYGHRQNYGTPKLVVPFTDRCILLGVLPRPAKGYVVEWPEPESLTAPEKADLAAKNTSADAQYVSGGVDALIPPFDYLTRVRGFTEEEAQAILEGAEEHAAELSTAGLGPDGQPLPEGETSTGPLLERISGISGAVELFKLRKDGAISDETLQELLMLFYQLGPTEAKKLVADGLPEPPAPPTPPAPPPGSVPPKPKVPPGQPPGTKVAMNTNPWIPFAYAGNATKGNKSKKPALTGGRWITVEGTHIYLKGGKYFVGPPSLAAVLGKTLIDAKGNPKKVPAEKGGKAKDTTPKVGKKTGQIEGYDPGDEDHGSSKPKAKPALPTLKPASTTPTPPKPTPSLTPAPTTAGPDWREARKRKEKDARELGGKLDKTQSLSVKGPPPVTRKEAREAIHNYTGDAFYKGVNKSLREGAEVDKVPPPSNKHLQALAQQELKEPVFVYRGLDKKAAAAFEKLAAGDEVVHRGFVSTTLLPKVATEGFAKSGGVLLEIKAKRGVYVDPHSQHEGEYEMIQAHGTRYRVIVSKKNAGPPGAENLTLIRLEEI